MAYDNAFINTNFNIHVDCAVMHKHDMTVSLYSESELSTFYVLLCLVALEVFVVNCD